MSIEIQARDVKILKYVFENRVATPQQIRRVAFPNNQKSVVSRRLCLLRDEGLLKQHGLIRNNKLQIYYETTEKAFAKICHSWQFVVDKPHFQSESPLHDIRLADLRTEFEKLKCFDSFIPENLLESSTEIQEDAQFCNVTRVHPDAALFLKDKLGQKHLFAIEFEGSKKSQDRYFEKLSSYRLRNRLRGVIYICSEQQIMNSLARIDAELRGERDSYLYFGLESEVLNFQDKMFFKNAKEHGVQFS